MVTKTYKNKEKIARTDAKKYLEISMEIKQIQPSCATETTIAKTTRNK